MLWSVCQPICLRPRAYPSPSWSSTAPGSRAARTRTAETSFSSTPARSSRRARRKISCSMSTFKRSSTHTARAPNLTSTRTSHHLRRSRRTSTTSTFPATWTHSNPKRRSMWLGCKRRLTDWRTNWSMCAAGWLTTLRSWAFMLSGDNGRRPGHRRASESEMKPRWKEVRLGSLIELRNGINFTQASRGRRVKVVGVGDFQNREVLSEFETTGTTVIDGDLQPDDLLADNDLLFVRSNGNKALVGRCVI